MEEVTEDTYLGDILSIDGKNYKNIKSRISKGNGIIARIFNILEAVSFGSHYFDIALLLRESMLINGSMYNAGIWYNFDDKEMKEFIYLDVLFLSKLMTVPRTIPHEALHLELGITTIDIIIKSRRIMYLHDIITRESQGMLQKFLRTQWNDPCKGDWTLLVKSDLQQVQLPVSINSLRKIS